MGKLKNKIALVSGAGRGIGRAVVLKLAGEGAALVALALAFAQPARFPLLAELLELARELVEFVVEGEDDFGRARDVVAVEQAAVAVDRITSYNVCYTKLLRIQIAAVTEFGPG